MEDFFTFSPFSEDLMPCDQELAQVIAALGNDDEPGGESFEQLFLRLESMKGKLLFLC